MNGYVAGSRPGNMGVSVAAHTIIIEMKKELALPILSQALYILLLNDQVPYTLEDI